MTFSAPTSARLEIPEDVPGGRRSDQPRDDFAGAGRQRLVDARRRSLVILAAGEGTR
jgi:hypothetical protein